MSRTEFACTADYFGAVRAAAIDAERIGRRLERMVAREGVRAQGYEAQGRGTRSDVNGTDATVGRMDWEGRIAARREGDYKLIDSACEVIYGSDQTGMGGIASLMGAATADAVWWRFCGAAQWREVAQRVEMSERWCQDQVAAAMDVCDAYGMEAMRRGLGVACG